MTLPRLWSSQERMLRLRSSTGSSPRSSPAHVQTAGCSVTVSIIIAFTGCDDVRTYFLPCISSAQRIIDCLFHCKLKTPPTSRVIREANTCTNVLNCLTVLI